MDLYTRTFTMAVAVLFALALYWMMTPFWGALAWGGCLALLLMPLQIWLTGKLRRRESAAAGIITTLVPLVLVAPLFSLGLIFADQVAALSQRLKLNPLRFDGGLLAQLEQEPFVGRVAGWLRQHLSATTEQLQGWLDSGVEKLLQSLAGSGGSFLLGAMTTVIHFFLMLFLLFFLLRDGRQMLASTVRMIPMAAERSAELTELIGDTVRAVVYGAVLTALAQGALVGVGFAIAGLSSPVVFGVMAAATAILPIGGAAIVWAPAVLYLAATGQWGWALFLTIWGIGVTVTDNFLRPMLISRHAPISVLAVFVGIIGGISAFGMIGIIIGPVVLAVLQALLRFFDVTNRAQRTAWNRPEKKPG